MHPYSFFIGKKILINLKKKTKQNKGDKGSLDKERERNKGRTLKKIEKPRPS